jgi:hypothetical protein
MAGLRMKIPSGHILGMVALCTWIIFPAGSKAQVEYLQKDEKAIFGGVSLSQAEQTTAIAMQIGFSADGRVGAGFLLGIVDVPKAKTLGLYLDANLLKAGMKQPIGVSALFSYARLFYSVGPNSYNVSSLTIQGESITFGVGTYFYAINAEKAALIPKFQISRAHSKLLSSPAVKTNATGFSLGLDLLLGAKSKQSILFSPHLIFIEDETSYGIAVTIIGK